MTSEVDPIATMKHVREARYCSRAGREWCAKYGLSWSEFVTSGFPCSVLEATGDAIGIRVAELARADHARKQG